MGGKSLKTIADVGKSLGLEAQLLQSAELVLRKLPTERGSFDGMVTQQLDEQFGKAIAKLTDQLTNGEAGKAERAGKVEVCNKQLEDAVQHGEVCQEQLKAAKQALQEAKAAKKAAENSVKDLGPEMREVVASAETADAVWVACKADLATFGELVESPSPAPE